MLKKCLFIVGFSLLFSCSKDIAEPGALVPHTVDEDTSIPSIPINGTLLHSESFGNATDPLLVIIHGGPGGDYRSMLSAKDFVNDGFYVVFYDQRSTGLSKREEASQFEGKDGIQIMIDDLNALIEYYKTSENQKIFLLGHSWGAMLATGYINQFQTKISGAVLAEPGGFTWAQTEDYLSRSNHIKFFSEALNDAVFTEQIFAGRSEQEILDYKASFFATYENAKGNTIGNAGHYPFWRNGAVSFNALIESAENNGFDFTTHLNNYTTKVLFMYSDLNTAYGSEWATKVSSPYPNIQLEEVKNTGHEMLYFGWTDLHPKALYYLNELK